MEKKEKLKEKKKTNFNFFIVFIIIPIKNYKKKVIDNEY